MAPAAHAPGWRASGLRALLVALAVLALILLRVTLGGRAEYLAGLDARAAQDEAEAVRRFEAAAHWYLPGAPWVEASLGALASIAEARAERGDRDGALRAWMALRSAVLGTRGLYVPNRPWLEEADAAIATLWLTDPEAAWPPREGGEAARRAEAERVLSAYPMPDPGWSLAAVLGFLGWIGAAVGFVMGGFDAEGALRRRPALAWGGAVIACFALWLIGMARA